MQEPCIKIFFNKSNYFIEENDINCEWEIIPLLVQGYLRCLNCLKNPIRGQDEQATADFLYIIREILSIFRENMDFIENNISNQDFNIIGFLKDTDNNGSKKPYLSKIFDYFDDIESKDNIDNIDSYSCIKYEIKLGPVVMYHIPISVGNYMQIYAYLFMFKKLLPLLNKKNAFTFFLIYMVKINNLILKTRKYSTIFGMMSIIRDSSKEMKELIDGMNEVGEIDNNDDFAKLRLCLP